MLSKENRLSKKDGFKAVYLKGKTYFLKNSGLTLRYAKNSLESSRIGFVVGKKYSNKATERNRLKRQLRGIFQKKLDKIKPGVDIIVSFKKKKGNSLPEKHKTLLKQAEEVLKQSNLLKK